MKKLLALTLSALMLFGAALSLASCGKKNDYSTLTILDLNQEREYFGIAFRTGSDLTRKVEDITLQLIKDGKLAELSSKYEVGAMSESEYTPKADACATSDDYSKIKAKGKLVIGITDYKPMDYHETASSTEWIGFDADYARLVCEKLGVSAEFVEIDWDNKLMALASGTIDCIWNGMTIDDAIEKAADCTIPYMYNTQVAVIRKADASKYTDLASLAGAKIAAEAGSAGEKLVKGNTSIASGLKSVTAQNDAILEVMAKTSDVAVVDLTLAKALIKN